MDTFSKLSPLYINFMTLAIVYGCTVIYWRHTQSPLPCFWSFVLVFSHTAINYFCLNKLIRKVLSNFKYLLNTDLHVKQWPFVRMLKIISELTYELNQHRYRKRAQSIRGIGWTNSRFIANLRHRFWKDFLRKPRSHFCLN